MKNIDRNLEEQLVLPMTSKKIDVVEALINQRADVNVISQKSKLSTLSSLVKFIKEDDPKYFTILDNLINHKADINFKDGDRLPVLSRAISLKKYKTVAKLLEVKNIDVNVVDNCYGKTPLMYSISNSDNSNLVNKLLDLKADLNPKSNLITSTPLTVSINKSRFESNSDFIKFLLSTNADINPKNDLITSTPLTAAIEANNFALVYKLLDLKSNVNSISNLTRLAPISYAIGKENWELVNKLVDMKADINLRGNLSLITVIGHKNWSMVERLLGIISKKDLEKDKSIYLLDQFYKLFTTHEIDNETIISTLKEIIKLKDKDIAQATIAKGSQTLIKIINDTGNFKEFKKDFTKLGIKYDAKYSSNKGDFLITSSDRLKEYDFPKHSVIKLESKTFFKDGKIWSVDTNKVVEKIDKDSYVVSKKGELYTNINGCNSRWHTYYLKGKPEDGLFGYGKPVACAGHITIKNGKITAIDTKSGHYLPTLEHLKVVLLYLMMYELVIINKNIIYLIPKRLAQNQ